MREMLSPTASIAGITVDNATLAQTGTDGLGVNFSITLGTANQGVKEVETTFKGSYSATTPGTTGVAGGPHFLRWGGPVVGDSAVFE